MKIRTYTDPLEPRQQIPWFERWQIDHIVEDEMRAAGMDPCEPQVHDPERFIMRRYGLGVDYMDFAEDVRGECVMSASGLEGIRLNRNLDGPGKGLDLLRRSTMAHESAGHATLHQAYIVPALRGEDRKAHYRRRCRREDIQDSAGLQPRGSVSLHRALEWQANYAMAAFILPRPGVLKLMGSPDNAQMPACILRDGFEFWRDFIMETFHASKPMTTYRLLDIFPALQDRVDAAGRGRVA